MKRAIIFSNGNLSDCSRAKKIIQSSDFIISADGGAEISYKFGIVPDVVIGDLDSLNIALVKKLLQQEVKFIKYPVRKDKTDFQLALEYAIKNVFQEIIIFGILGNRMDQNIANMYCISQISSKNQNIKIKVVEGNQEIYVLLKKIEINGKTGDLVSIIPITAKITGLTSTGLEYPLNNLTLTYGTTRGISNILITAKSIITAKSGKGYIIITRKNND